MPPGFQVLATRRFEPDADGEVPRAPGCRRRWGTTRLVAADLVAVAVAGHEVVTVGTREVRVHEAESGALRTWFHLEGGVHCAAVGAGGQSVWLVGWQERPTEIPGIGRATLRSPCAAHVDLRRGELTALAGEVPPVARYLAVNAPGSYLAVAPGDGAVRLLRLPGGEPVGEVRMAYPLDSVGFSPDGTRLEVRASGNPNPTAELNDRTPWRRARGSWSLPELVGDVADEVYRSEDRPRRRPPEAVLAELRAGLAPTDAMQLEPPGWVSRGLGAAPPEEIAAWPDADSPLVTTALAGGRGLVGGFADGTLRVADLRTERVHAPVLGDPGRVEALAISPDGEALVVAHAAGSILEWDLPELLQRSGVVAPEFRASLRL